MKGLLATTPSMRWVTIHKGRVPRNVLLLVQRPDAVLRRQLEMYPRGGKGVQRGAWVDVAAYRNRDAAQMHLVDALLNTLAQERVDQPVVPYAFAVDGRRLYLVARWSMLAASRLK
jgi:hypothetical protein